MDAILLRSLPVKDPESLAMINWHYEKGAFRRGIKGRLFRLCSGVATVVHAMSGSIYDS